MPVMHKRAESASYSNSNDNAVVNLISWVFTVTALSIIVFVLIHKMYTQRRKRPHIDEILLMVTGVLEFLQAASSAWQMTSGTGQNVGRLTEDSLQTMLKSGYLKSFFYLLIITFPKVSVLRTYHELTPQKPHRLLIRSTKVLVIICAITFLFVLGFQCPLPHPWDFTAHNCINRTAMWVAIGIWDIITDAAIVSLAFVFLWTLNISRVTRACCLAAFCFRALCIPASLVHAVFTVDYTKTNDFSKAVYTVALAGQTQYLITIIATSIPHITALADPLRRAYLAVVAQPPGLAFRLSWPGKVVPVDAFKSLSRSARSDPNSAAGSKINLVDSLNLTPLGLTLGKASRASGSHEDSLPNSTRSRSQNRDSIELGVMQTKEWTVREMPVDKK